MLENLQDVKILKLLAIGKNLKISLLGILCFLGLNASTEIIQLTPE
jgi:hypothetical protein